MKQTPKRHRREGTWKMEGPILSERFITWARKAFQANAPKFDTIIQESEHVSTCLRALLKDMPPPAPDDHHMATVMEYMTRAIRCLDASTVTIVAFHDLTRTIEGACAEHEED